MWSSCSNYVIRSNAVWLDRGRMASMATICVPSKRSFLLATVNQVPSPTLWVANMVSTIPLVRAVFQILAGKKNKQTTTTKKKHHQAWIKNLMDLSWSSHGNGIAEFNLALELFLAMFKMIDPLRCYCQWYYTLCMGYLKLMANSWLQCYPQCVSIETTHFYTNCL